MFLVVYAVVNVLTVMFLIHCLIYRLKQFQNNIFDDVTHAHTLVRSFNKRQKTSALGCFSCMFDKDGKQPFLSAIRRVQSGNIITMSVIFRRKKKMSKVLFTCALVVNLMIVSCAGASETEKAPTINDDSGSILQKILARWKEIEETIDQLMVNSKTLSMK